MTGMVLTVEGAGPIGNPFAFLRGPRGVVAIWLVASVLLIGFSARMIAGLQAQDPDDFMRLLEVRDWLAGQSWWDVHQYRMNPPFGADMHWSRLIDLPIGVLLAGFRLILPEQMATGAAMTLWPLMQLLVAMLLVRRLVLALGEGEGTAMVGAAIVPLFPVLTTTFMPLRIDHHGAQAIMALWSVLTLRRPGARGAATAGLLVALWLEISLEGLMLAACLSALLALRYLTRRQADLAPFLAAPATGSALIFVMTRPLSHLSHPTTDAMSWPHMAAFALGAALMAALPRMPGQDSPGGRLVGLAMVAIAGAGVILGGLGPGALNPFARLDPVVRAWWFDKIPEGLPITAQDVQTVAMLVWTLGLAGAGLVFARRHARRPEQWNEPAAMALVAALLSLLIMRSSVAAQLLCVPLSALMIARLFPRARALKGAPARIVGSLACVLLLTPSFASGAGKVLQQHLPASDPGARGLGAPSRAGSTACDLAGLVRLPRATLFATLDLGPEILVRTQHNVVMSGYHRNSPVMARVIEAFSGDPAQARELVRESHAGYVVLCTADPEAWTMASRRPDDLAASLLADRVPAWLVPQGGFGNALKVYAIRP